jgi:hypothetical protein
VVMTWFEIVEMVVVGLVILFAIGLYRSLP